MNDYLTLNKLMPGADFHVHSPGRVNLLGEHVDYNQGMVLPAAIDRFLHLAAKSRNDRIVSLNALNYGETVEFSLDHLEQRVNLHNQPLPRWALYPAGVAWSLQAGGLLLNGIDAVYTSDVPIGAGLSSSAAVELAFAVTWQAAADWHLERMQLAQACQFAENRYVGVNCGLMDQFACAHGVARHALLFDVRTLSWQPLPMPPETSIVIAESGIKRDLANSAYNLRRHECDEAVELLKKELPSIQSLRDVTPEAFEEYQEILPEVIRKRARHVIEEIERVKQASYRLVEDDAEGFGRLMVEGHRSLRDLFKVSIPELDLLVEIALGIRGCLGSRMTGAGFGGCTVSLVAKQEADKFSQLLAEQYQIKTGSTAKVYICQPGRGVWLEEENHG